MPPLFQSDLEHVLEQTQHLWAELKGKRLFITGGTGFFGCWLLETFSHANSELSLGAQAVVLTRNPDAFRQKMPHLVSRGDIELLKGDVRTFDFPQGPFSHVIHGGTTSSAPVPPREMFDTIVDGTRRVLEFANRSGTRKLLFISSGAVYGRQPEGMQAIPEEYRGAPDPTDPNSAYGEGKRAAELLCTLAHQEHGIETKIARCFAFVGPHLPLDAHFAIGNFIRDALRGGPIVVNNGAPYRSYLYAADLAIWLWTILFRGAVIRTYNVGSDAALTVSDLAKSIAGISLSPIEERAASKTALASHYVPCVTRTQQELNLKVSIELAEAIERTISWYPPQLLRESLGADVWTYPPPKPKLAS